jgi:hypothetical protein
LELEAAFFFFFLIFFFPPEAFLQARVGVRCGEWLERDALNAKQPHDVA